MKCLRMDFQFARLLAFSVLLCGCSSSKGPLFQTITDIPADRSVIYAFRPDDNKRTEFTFTCNGREIGILKRQGYFPILVEPGKVEIISKVRFKMFVTGLLGPAMIEPSEYVFEAKPGTVYYVECLAGELGGQKLSISLVPERYGQLKIQECHLLTAASE